MVAVSDRSMRPWHQPPDLMKLLETEQISYERPGAGRHRRVRLSDVHRLTLDEAIESAYELVVGNPRRAFKRQR